MTTGKTIALTIWTFVSKVIHEFSIVKENIVKLPQTQRLKIIPIYDLPVSLSQEFRHALARASAQGLTGHNQSVWGGSRFI